MLIIPVVQAFKSTPLFRKKKLRIRHRRKQHHHGAIKKSSIISISRSTKREYMRLKRRPSDDETTTKSSSGHTLTATTTPPTTTHSVEVPNGIGTTNTATAAASIVTKNIATATNSITLQTILSKKEMNRKSRNGKKRRERSQQNKMILERASELIGMVITFDPTCAMLHDNQLERPKRGRLRTLQQTESYNDSLLDVEFSVCSSSLDGNNDDFDKSLPHIFHKSLVPIGNDDDDDDFDDADDIWFYEEGYNYASIDNRNKNKEEQDDDNSEIEIIFLPNIDEDNNDNNEDKDDDYFSWCGSHASAPSYEWFLPEHLSVPPRQRIFPLFFNDAPTKPCNKIFIKESPNQSRLLEDDQSAEQTIISDVSGASAAVQSLLDFCNNK